MCVTPTRPRFHPADRPLTLLFTFLLFIAFATIALGKRVPLQPIALARSVSVANAAQSATSVAAGFLTAHTCAVTSTGGVLCWGAIGDGTYTDSVTPVAVSGLATGVTSVAVGYQHTCAVTSSGGVFCWGRNLYGELGNGTTNNSITPVAVKGLPNGITAVAAGYHYTCALTSSGGVFCWGRFPPNFDSLTPMAISGLTSGVTTVAAGVDYVCVVTNGGGVLCWGGNSNGQLGDGTTTDRLTPVAVSGLASGVQGVTVGEFHTCAVTSSGSVFCWGHNFFGQLGDGTTTTRLTPVAVSGLASGATGLIEGKAHTCATTISSGVFCWGINGNGQLGDGTTTTRLTPVAVSGLASGITTVAAGYDYTCGVANTGSVFCWGGNSSGEVGDGTRVDRLLPVLVFGGGGPPPPPLNLSITNLSDSRNNALFPPDLSARGTVDGNVVTAKVTINQQNNQTLQGTLSLMTGQVARVQQPITIHPNQTQDVVLSFPVKNMAWDALGNRTDVYTLTASFATSASTPVTSAPIMFRVRPRPVVLVHGWGDTAVSWDTYRDVFLRNIGITEVYPIDTMNTGGAGNVLDQIGWVTATTDENARRLRDYINEKATASGADEVDVVAHSLGGLITRKYINTYMTAPTPRVRQLIMLGTPNLGSLTAEEALVGLGAVGLFGQLTAVVGFRYPATLELLPSYLRSFNLSNSNQRNVAFYAVAGNYRCLNSFGVPQEFPGINPFEPYPNDMIVWNESVFAIPLNGHWTFPGANLAGCNGKHSRMRGVGLNEGGEDIFIDYVKPLLEGVLPSAPQAQEIQADTSQTAFDILNATQSTNVQTGTLLSGGRLEFSRSPEGAPNYTFVVIGQPDAMKVSIRDPNGKIFSPGTNDSQVQYMQMEKDFLPITTYTISNPVAGIWTTIVDANAQTPATGIGVSAFGSLTSNLRLTALPPSNAPLINNPVAITAQLQSNTAPILGAKVSALFTAQGGSTTTITLLDDGLHDDGVAGDGVYGYSFTPQTPGVYSAVISASGTRSGVAFYRSSVWAAPVAGVQISLPLVQR